MSLGISDSPEGGRENFFDLVWSFFYALVVGDQSEQGKLQYVFQVGDGSKPVLFHEQIVRHTQHGRVDRSGLERERAVRHFAQIDHFHVFGIDLVVLEDF